MFDANSDGVISYEEIGTAMRALGQNPTEAEVAELMDKVDKDGMTQMCSFKPVYINRSVA